MSDLIESIEAGVAILTMNRPEARNALSLEMHERLNEALPRLHADPKVGAIILTGAGNAFCAGGDVKGFAGTSGGANGGRTLEGAALDLRRNMDVSRWLHDGPKLTVAAIPGACAGAGLSLALACDFRIAAKSAKLTTAFIKVALSGDFGGTFYLTQLLGSAKARELYFLSDILSGEDAERIGLVNRAVDSLEVMTEAMGLAKRFADGPRVALGLMKKSLNVAERGDHGLSLDTEALNHSRSAGTADHTEGARAFVERRAPVYSGS